MGIPHTISQKFPRFHSIVHTKISLLFFLRRNNSKWKDFALSNLKKNKRYNKTFLILGSGESINKLNKDFWSWAHKNTCTIAVGSWWYHDFIPDIYCVECETRNCEKTYKKWISQINKKYKKYKKTIFLPKVYGKNLNKNLNLDATYDNLLKQFKYPNWYQAPSGSIETFRFFCANTYKFLKIFNLNYIASIRSNIVFATLIAKELGAEKIILAGVDGYGGYFYNKYLTKNELNKRPELVRTIQRGSDKNHGVPTIPQIMNSINRYIVPVQYIGKSMLKNYLKEFDFQKEN